jgi:hypothetical protein
MKRRSGWKLSSSILLSELDFREKRLKKLAEVVGLNPTISFNLVRYGIILGDF